MLLSISSSNLNVSSPNYNHSAQGLLHLEHMSHCTVMRANLFLPLELNSMDASVEHSLPTVSELIDTALGVICMWRKLSISI